MHEIGNTLWSTFKKSFKQAQKHADSSGILRTYSTSFRRVWNIGDHGTGAGDRATFDSVRGSLQRIQEGRRFPSARRVYTAEDVAEYAPFKQRQKQTAAIRNYLNCQKRRTERPY